MIEERKLNGVRLARPGRQKKPYWTVGKVIVYLFLLAGGVMMLLPLLWMITTSLSSSHYAMDFPPQFFPKQFDWENYVKIFTESGLGQSALNSVIITVPAIIGQVFASALAAYAFARLRAPGKSVLFIIVLATLMIPGEVTLIPTFILFKYLNWLNTFWPLIVPNFFGNAYNIFLMRQFFMSIPLELDEAAKLDGLGPFGIWVRIILPLGKPVLAAVAIFTFTANWGNFLTPLIYITNPHLYPLALSVYTMTETGDNAVLSVPWNLIMAGSMLLTLPMTLVFFFGQRALYEGSNVLGRVG